MSSLCTQLMSDFRILRTQGGVLAPCITKTYLYREPDNLRCKDASEEGCQGKGEVSIATVQLKEVVGPIGL